MSATPPQAPLKLNPDFERAFAALACHRPRFYGRIGHEVDPALLTDPRATLALETARSIYKELGTGPDSLLLIAQRLQRQHQQGKITKEQVFGVVEYLEDALDAGLPNEDAAIKEVAPLLKQRLEEKAIRAAMTAHAQHGSLDETQKLLTRADRIGIQDVSVGLKLGDASFDAIDRMQALERLPTGMGEVDAYIGGLYRGGLGVILASTGIGKSQALSQLAGEGIMQDKFVAVVTLELPPPLWLARVKANLLDVPVDVLTGAPSKQKTEARNKFAHLRLGPLVIKEFDSGISTVEDIVAWLEIVEAEAERKVDLLVVDYGDKLTARVPANEKNSYNVGLLVFEKLRLWAWQNNRWCWTASQAQRLKDKQQRVDIEHVADSIHKMRVANLVITFTRRGENDDELLVFVAKNTAGKDRIECGPYPTEYEFGRAVGRSR